VFDNSKCNVYFDMVYFSVFDLENVYFTES